MQLAAKGRQWLPPSIHSVTTQFNFKHQQVEDSRPVSELQQTSLIPQAGVYEELDTVCSQSEYITQHKTLIQSGSKMQHERDKINSSVPQS